MQNFNVNQLVSNVDWQMFFNYLAQFGLALVFLFVGWVIVKWVSGLVAKVIKNCKLLKTFFEKIGLPVNLEHAGNFVGILLYVIGLLLVFNQFFDLLGLTTLTEPLQRVVTQLLDFVPKALTSLALFVLVRAWANITKNTLKKWFDQIGLDQKAGDYVAWASLSETLASAAYWFVFLVFLPTIIGPLGLDWLYEPVNQLVKSIWDFVPNLVVATVILGIGVIVGKILKEIVTKLLASFGIDKVSEKLGIGQAAQISLAELGGILAATFVILIAATEAASRLNLEVIYKVLNQVLEFGINVVVGGIVIAFGFYLASLVGEILKSTSKSEILPEIVKWAIMFLALGMGLGQIGVGEDIIYWSFVLVVGAFAVAFALAVGLGGKDVAKEWLKKVLK